MPVGCIPPACRPYLPAYSAPGEGGFLAGGVSALLGGVYLARGVCLGGVCLARSVCLAGGVSLPGG